MHSSPAHPAIAVDGARDPAPAWPFGRWAPAAGVALSGLLMAASAPGVGELAWLTWIAFVPWLATLAGLTPARAALSGLAMGLAYTIPGRWETFATAIGATGTQGLERDLWTLLLFATYGVPFAIFAAVDRAMAPRIARLPGALVAPLRASSLAGLICGLWTPFPYTPVVGLVDFIGIAQWASVGGEALLLSLLLWPGMVLAQLLTVRVGLRAAARRVAPVVAVLVALSLAGHARIAAMDRSEARGEGQRLSLLPLQLDLPPGASPVTLWRDNPGSAQSAIEATRSALRQQPQCEAVVWPETTVAARHGARACAAGQRLATELGVPLLMQCYRGDERLRMSAEWHRPDQPAVTVHYKSSLVPLYETPLRGAGGLEAGRPGHVYAVDAQRSLIPALCYELYSDAHLRASVLAGGQFIAHMVSFAAFDRQPVDLWDGPMARLRAIAFGVPIARAGNRSFSGWIDANGRVRSASARFGREARCHGLWSPATAPTPYTHVAGHAAGLPAALVLAIALIAVPLRRRMSRLRSVIHPTRSKP
jgi:apolipoprotein N-acyltransferase